MERAVKFSLRGVTDATRWFYAGDQDMYTNYSAFADPPNGVEIKIFILHQNEDEESIAVNDFFAEHMKLTGWQIEGHNRLRVGDVRVQL